MPRKKKDEDDIDTTLGEGDESVSSSSTSLPSLTPVSGDFGREDLNALRDKVNEIIEHLTK